METISEQEIYSVSQLNFEARELLENSFPHVMVSGEISNLARPSSGHWYFSLKDEDAQVRCAMFRGHNRLVDFAPEAGMQVLVSAKLSLYPARGDYQLIVSAMQPAGFGALQRAFEQLKQKLDKEGLFNPEHKAELPELPRCIGVITSPTGAAIRDVLTTLKRRFPSIPVIVYPTVVQGKEAPAQIVQALRRAEQHATCDCLIVARGGGSLEDLWAFNDEAVARAIFASSIPIIAGIGHEVDFTIADFVADQRAATPTAAAELASPDERDYLAILANQFEYLCQLIRDQISHQRQSLIWLRKRLRHPGQQLQDTMQRLDRVEQHLLLLWKKLFAEKTHQLASLSRALDAISPLATLDRGYAIVTDTKQHVITKAESQHIGQQVTARLAEGSLLCTVDEVKK